VGREIRGFPRVLTACYKSFGAPLTSILKDVTVAAHLSADQRKNMIPNASLCSRFAGQLKFLATKATAGWARVALFLGAAGGLFLAAAANAQTLPPPQNVIALSASASLEVNKDWLTVVFSTTRDGPDAAGVQAQLRTALEAAVAEAKKITKPEQVELQTGAFSLFPRYAPPSQKQQSSGQPGAINGWQGTTELVVEGRDMQAIAQLTARIQTLSIARVATSLSRQARQKVEGEITAQAIERFRARADAVTKQFGFGSWTVREVAVNAESPGTPQFQAMAMRARINEGADQALPVEAGKTTVTANVSGSVQMK
jgi:predicted secreted protein